MSKLTRTNAILPYPPLGDLTDKIGMPVELTYSNGVAKVNLWEPGASTPFGVVLDANESQASIALFHGGLAGSVKVKLVEAVTPGVLLCLAQNNGVNGFANREEESFAGDTYICGQALETGVEGEEIEAVLFRPEPLTIA